MILISKHRHHLTGITLGCFRRYEPLSLINRDPRAMQNPPLRAYRPPSATGNPPLPVGSGISPPIAISAANAPALPRRGSDPEVTRKGNQPNGESVDTP